MPMNSRYPFILTLPLWRMFYRILPQHPIFWQKILRQRKRMPKQKQTRWARARRFFVVLFGVTLAIPVMALLAFPAALLVVILILFGGLASGLQAALGVSAVVSSEYQLGRGDLLSMSPHGRVGLCWALAARHIRTDKTSLRLRRLIVAGFLFVSIGIAVVGLANIVGILIVSIDRMSSTAIPVSTQLEILVPLVTAVVVLAVLYIDLIQSTILGAVAGMLAGIVVHDRAGATWLAAALFLLEQFAFYVFVALVIRAGDGEQTPLIALLFTLLQAGGILLVRELVMHGALRLAMRALNTDWRELMTLPALRT